MAKYNMSEQDAEKVLSNLLKDIDTVKLIKDIMDVINNGSSNPCYKEIEDNSNSNKEYTHYKIVKYEGDIYLLNVKEKTLIDNIDLESAKSLAKELNRNLEEGQYYGIVKQPLYKDATSEV